jgi:hypothetical protein
MDDLATLMREAVEDVEPSDRRAELRERVAAASKRRRVRYGVTVGLLAAAAVTTGVAVAVHQSGGPEAQVSHGTHAVDRSRDQRPAYALYYVGDTPQGPRLFREFRTGPGPDTTPGAALDLLQADPDDPDYASYWSPGQLLGAELVDDVIEVDVDPSLAQLSAGMSVADGELALQQVVYTVQAAAGDAQLPVQFVHDGNPVAEVFGQPTSEPLTSAPQLDVLALASISDPTERRVVVDSFSARGRASSFEGNVPWELRAPDGSVVRSGTSQTYGWEDHLYPWATGPIDVSDLEPGDYTFAVMTDDPSGGEEGAGPTVDTRTVVIK